MKKRHSTSPETLKEIQSKLNKEGSKELKKIKKLIYLFFSIILALAFLISLTMEESQKSFEKNIISNYPSIFIFTLIILLFSNIILNVCLGKSKEVSFIASVSGYIRTDSTSHMTASGALATQTYYYLELINSSHPLKSTLINNIQYGSNKVNADDYIECFVAYIEPTSVEKITYARHGSICLLPFDDYCDASNNHLINISKGKWLAPEQKEHQPVFETPRDFFNTKDQYKLTCESRLHPNMDRIKFLYINEDTLHSTKEGPSYEKDIGNVFFLTNESNDFMDVRTSIKTDKDRKGPHFLVYCFVAYAINYFLIDNIEIWPDLSFYVFILISIITLTAILYYTFHPIKVPLPIRMNRQKQEIYVFRDKSLYCIPWKESDFSIISHQSNGKAIYNLTLWLDPKHDTYNLSKRTQQVIVYSAENIHGRAFLFWEYINRYMKFDTPFQKEKYNKEDDIQKKENFFKKTSMLIISAIICILLSPILLPVFVSLSNPAYFLRSKLNPFKTRWPKEIHALSKNIKNWY